VFSVMAELDFRMLPRLITELSIESFTPALFTVPVPGAASSPGIPNSPLSRASIEVASG